MNKYFWGIMPGVGDTKTAILKKCKLSLPGCACITSASNVSSCHPWYLIMRLLRLLTRFNSIPFLLESPSRSTCTNDGILSLLTSEGQSKELVNSSIKRNFSAILNLSWCETGQSIPVSESRGLHVLWSEGYGTHTIWKSCFRMWHSRELYV